MDAAVRAPPVSAEGGPPPDATLAPMAIANVGSPGIRQLLRRSALMLRPFLGWIVTAWALGVLALSVRLIGGWVRLRSLTRLDASPVPEAVRDVARELATRLAVSRPVRLVRSARATGPAVVGWLRPVILLPVTALTGLTPAQLEAIIAHELAHIRRHDYLVNLMQTVVETVLFYHPAVWWVSGRIRDEREHCCDDLAVRVCGDRRLYASALLELETLRPPAMPLAVAAGGGSLVMRVRRLMDPRAERTTMSPRSSAALSTAAVATAMTFACGGEALLSPLQWDEGVAPVFITATWDASVFRYIVTDDGDAIYDRTIAASAPIGIAFDPAGEMFVANRTGSVARYLDPQRDATPNGLITPESAGVPFGQPHFLEFRNDELFVSQPSGNVLRFTFDASGNAVFNGSLTAGDESRGILADPATGEIFVSKLENAIHRFALDDARASAEGDLIIGGGLNHTHNMTFTPWGELLVANAYGNSVSRFVFNRAGDAVPNGMIAGGGMAMPVDLDFSPWGELFVTNHNVVPGRVTRWTFTASDASAEAVYNGSFEVPANITGVRFADRD